MLRRVWDHRACGQRVDSSGANGRGNGTTIHMYLQVMDQGLENLKRRVETISTALWRGSGSTWTASDQARGGTSFALERFVEIRALYSRWQSERRHVLGLNRYERSYLAVLTRYGPVGNTRPSDSAEVSWRMWYRFWTRGAGNAKGLGLYEPGYVFF